MPAFACRDVDQLLASVPARVLDNWRTVYDWEPWGEERIELLLGNLSALVEANLRKDGRTYKALDYMPYHPSKRRKARTTPEGLAGMKAAWENAAKLWNENLARKRKGKP